MKLILLCSLFLLIGCVKEESPTEALEDQTFNLNPQTPKDVDKIAAICNALEEKESMLSVLVSSRYTFGVSQKKCSSGDLGSEALVSVTLQRPFNDYIFSNLDGSPFIYPDVETTQKGAMVEICKQIADLKSPMVTSSRSAIHFTTLTSSKYCKEDESHFCIHIQKGNLAGNGSYKTHTNEWIKFRIKNGRVGFFTQRHTLSNAGCSKGKSLERRVTLK